MKWTSTHQGFDEAFHPGGKPRELYSSIVDILGTLTPEEIAYRGRMYDISARNQGITFNVYGDTEGDERVFPFDFVPRVISAHDWAHVESGLIQRTEVLNLFLNDVYGEQRCMKDGIVPFDLVYSRSDYRRQLMGAKPAHGVYTHVVGSDIIRDDKGEFLVLEDNCRCPSGVSYVLQNRKALRRIFPELFAAFPIHSVDHYADMLRESLAFMSPRGARQGLCVVLTPGKANSAYSEHAFLAREMGLLLVQGEDLVVEDNYVYVKTTSGRKLVDVIYRRIDDEFIDPLCFRRDSRLGIPGLINAYHAGNIAIANAPGSGVADDKAIYPYLPALTKYFLGQDPIIQQVPTFKGADPKEADYILKNIENLVIKKTDGSGGYGILIGPKSTKAEQEDFKAQVKANPGAYIGQPLVELSAHPTYLDGAYRARRLDFRPFVIYGDRVRVLPGGLTRVALKEGSYIVNSSQGGGSKDTWIMQPEGGEVKA